MGICNGIQAWRNLFRVHYSCTRIFQLDYAQPISGWANFIMIYITALASHLHTSKATETWVEG